MKKLLGLVQIADLSLTILVTREAIVAVNAETIWNTCFLRVLTLTNGDPDLEEIYQTNPPRWDKADFRHEGWE